MRDCVVLESPLLSRAKNYTIAFQEIPVELHLGFVAVDRPHEHETLVVGEARDLRADAVHVHSVVRRIGSPPEDFFLRQMDQEVLFDEIMRRSRQMNDHETAKPDVCVGTVCDFYDGPIVDVVNQRENKHASLFVHVAYFSRTRADSEQAKNNNK